MKSFDCRVVLLLVFSQVELQTANTIKHDLDCEEERFACLAA